MPCPMPHSLDLQAHPSRLQTGTPLRSWEIISASTIFKRAVEDRATVRIYYEARLARLELREEERPKIDPEFEEVTEGEEQTTKESLKRKWAQLEAMIGTEKRIGLVAKDIVDHFEKRRTIKSH